MDREGPPAPSAEEWALAATYTPKNAKRYRHNWGQQVRSLRGTAFEGPGQGSVRFRIEIASRGQIARGRTARPPGGAAGAAEAADDQRQLEQWRSQKLGR